MDSPPAGAFHEELGVPQRRRDLFHLRVRDNAGKGTVLEVSTTDTVRDVKARLEQCWGSRMKDQRLIYKGTMMVDERSLGSYDLETGSVVVFAPQLRLRHGSGINGGVAWNKSRGPGKAMPYDAPRGFLMVPGVDNWRPDLAGKTNVHEADLFFDSKKAPAPWEIQSRELKAGPRKAPVCA
ncbi:unnamed protein product [Effrenium voratum]|uniref:Ubiquitin-like domain-containing protein n=1 Tax=Effrenium voratum TaxID=2562239 RepID=A0AA36ICY6_9DINO|nr:unnamed protein product [Effrenium voratum]CAJ1417277.1 unnamed protein product [Effrenium voratum]